MQEIKRGWDEFWAGVIGIKIYGTTKNAFKVAKFQVNHIIKVLNLKRGSRILDIGCGAGFHCIELAKRGFKVTGIDISESLINSAKRLALEKKIKAKFFVMDMRSIKFRKEFDAIVMLNQTFPIFDDKETIQVLRKCNLALKNNGKLYIQSLNPFVYAKKFSRYQEWSRKDDGYRLLQLKFDPIEQRVEGENIYILDDGKVIKEKEDDIKAISFRLFTPEKWKQFLNSAGFSSLNLYASQKIPPERFELSSGDLIITAQKIRR